MRLELSLQLVRVATTGSLEAGRNGSSVRPRTPQERDTGRLQRKTPPRAARDGERNNFQGALIDDDNDDAIDAQQ